MTEVEHPEPIPAVAQRMTAAAETHAFRSLLAHLDSEGLQVVRTRLKDLDFVRLCGSGNLAEMRAECLDAACRRLIGLEPTMRDYYAPDMLPDVPDVVPDFGGGAGVM